MTKDPEKVRQQLDRAREGYRFRGERGGTAARKLKAFEDFWAMGPGRSIQGLLRRYQEIAEREGPEAVPTLSKQVLLRWCHEGDWWNRALERDQKAYTAARVTIEEARAGAFKALGQFVTAALGVVEQILDGTEKASPAVKLRAAQLVFELAGLKAPPPEAKDKPLSLPEPPPPEASDEEFVAYYRKLLGGS